MNSFFKIFTASKNSFDGEEKDEKVMLLLRRHPFVILIKLLFFVFLALVPIIFWNFFASFWPLERFFKLFLFISAAWYLLVWSATFYALTMYTLDVWIVTNRRIIDSKQNGFWSRTVSELHVNRIQDISVETKGVIPTFLHFGDLHIQTAGAEEKFRFFQIPEPERVKDEIMKLPLWYNKQNA